MDKKTVLDQEKELQFETFDNDLALRINETIIERVKMDFPKPVVIALCTLITCETKQYKEWESSELYAICGGGFPIIKQNEVKGAICVSGLDHLDDHEVIIESLRKVL